MNNTNTFDEDPKTFFNETTAPTFTPTDDFDRMGESLTPQQRGTEMNSAMTILFLLGCLAIALVWAVVAARNYSSPRVANDGELTEDKATLEDLEKQMLQHFTEKANRTILKADNIFQDITEATATESSDDNDDMTDIDLEVGDNEGHIVIQRAMSDGKSKEVTAPNLCTICLESYQPGDTVTWSTNDECPHLYHQVCVAAYFAHSKKKGHKQCLCPSCRREYITLNSDINTEQESQQDFRRASQILQETNLMRQQRINANIRYS